MCYICQARGHVGANYVTTQKTIAGAIKALGSTPESERLAVEACWGDRRDWMKAPRGKLWNAADLKAYATKKEELSHAIHS